MGRAGLSSLGVPAALSLLMTFTAIAQEEPTGDTLDMKYAGILDEEEFKALHELREDEPVAPMGEMVELAGGQAYLSLPEGEAPFPGIVVFHEWWGLNEHIKHWSDRLAADGYAALAVDLYDGVVATTRDGAYETMSSLTDERGHEIIAAAVAFLAEDERIRATKRASIGWCFGGGWSLNAAIAHPELDACVIYYGRLTDDPALLGRIGATVCGVFGKQDKGFPKELLNNFGDALAEAGVSAEIHRFDGDHAFANPSSARYNEKAAAKAWEVVRAFLGRELKGEGATPPTDGPAGEPSGSL